MSRAPAFSPVAKPKAGSADSIALPLPGTAANVPARPVARAVPSSQNQESGMRTQSRALGALVLALSIGTAAPAFSQTPDVPTPDFEIVEATIDQIQDAIRAGEITSTDAL